MKRLTILILATGLFSSLTFGQVELSFENHALKAGANNPMSYCNYLEPGQAGADMLWDFSELKFEKSFTGFINHSGESELGNEYSNANTDLQEFNSHFYFNVNQDQIEQYGYSSNDGKVQTHYSTPFIKMKYPFTYGDNYVGSFSGISVYSGIERGSIAGSYEVDADAYGTLVLPGGVSYENTLRVRTVKRYTDTYQTSEREVEIITYRWYNGAHRYPLLVLTEYSIQTGQNTTTNYQAAYNNNAVPTLPVNAESISLYPNPVADYLVLEYEGLAAGVLEISITDITGKVVTSFIEEVSEAGVKQLDLSEKISGFKPSSYILRIKQGEELHTRTFTITD